uniref:Cytochrome P450 2J2-like n=1 Tax=Mastacembelus armatus TaxID=205130 RepID=A0A7N8X4V2_9TELE
MDVLSGVYVSPAWQWVDTWSLLMFALVLLVVSEYVRSRRPSNFPPGPWALPKVTYMLISLLLFTCQLAQKYGNIYSLKMGPKWMVVLNGLSTLQEGLLTKGDILADRPVVPLHDDMFPNLGLVFTNGHIWKQQRRFTLFTLKSLGVGKKSLESPILTEFIYMSNEIANQKGKPFSPILIIRNGVSNIICSLVFGHRFEYGNEKFVLHLFCSSGNILWPHQTLKKIYGEVINFVKTEIKKHKEDWDPSEPRNFIDCYLKEIHRVNGEVDTDFHEDNLVMCSFDLFGAGTETTSTTLLWALLYMATYTEIQEKVQAEIDAVLGQSRQPSMEDRANLPYTDAVIHEVQRMGNIAPLSVPHVTNRELQLEGYTIPKGVTVIPNLTSVLFDKKEWETPDTFNPRHFLNEEGKFVKPAAFIPFSAGKRVCLGENLARMELFLLFTSLLQCFTFSMPPGVKSVLTPCFGLTLSPSPYEICATSRGI